MRVDRWLIVSLISLVAGLWLAFAWCHGSVGLAFAYPLAGTKLSIDITSTGGVLLLGIPLVFLGVLLMLIAFLSALLAQLRRSPSAPKKNAAAPPSTPSVT
jgi:apolipoprotein N-acyltransferase